MSKHIKHNKDILLGILPFWSPLIPPLGITSLKSFLNKHGFCVKTIDLNTNLQLKRVHDKYFDLLRTQLPNNKIGNLLNIGYDLMQNHFMCYLDYNKSEYYQDYIKELVLKSFYTDFDSNQVDSLNSIVCEFFETLEKHVIGILELENPDVFGLSVYRNTLPASLFAMKLAKSINSKIINVMGGAIFSQDFCANSSNLETLSKKASYIDHFLIGEGEYLFLKLLQGKLPGSQRINTLDDIDSETIDINSSPCPDFTDLDLSNYLYLSAYGSRSCPFQCKFCAETKYWGKYRKKSAQKIVNELSHLSEKYRHQLFLLCDSLLNPVIDNLSLAFNEHDKSIYWDGYLRVDKKVSEPEKTMQWRRGGFYRARLGIESGSQKILDKMDKRITVDQIKEALINLASSGIKTTTYWIIGYPGETEEDFQNTLDLLTELKDEIYEAECNHFRYYVEGQVNAAEWKKSGKVVPLYSMELKEDNLVQSWILNDPPTREVTMERVNRFNQHCRQIGIPNPYTLEDIHQADERWKMLHKNAVPALSDFYGQKEAINENKSVSFFQYAENLFEQDEGSFSF